MKIPPSILRYWLAMNATSLDAAVSSAVMFCGAAGAHQATAELGFSIQAFNLQQFALLFLGSFGWAILQYLHAHPVAELLNHDDVLSQLERELRTQTTADVGKSTAAAPVSETQKLSNSQTL